MTGSFEAAELFAQVMDKANRANPYPLYARLRETPVVCAGDGLYLVSTYDEIRTVLLHPKASSEVRPIACYGHEVRALHAVDDAVSQRQGSPRKSAANWLARWARRVEAALPMDRRSLAKSGEETPWYLSHRYENGVDACEFFEFHSVLDKKTRGWLADALRICTDVL